MFDPERLSLKVVIGDIAHDGGARTAATPLRDKRPEGRDARGVRLRAP
jgi:hypothetical protein